MPVQRREGRLAVGPFGYEFAVTELQVGCQESYGQTRQPDLSTANTIGVNMEVGEEEVWWKSSLPITPEKRQKLYHAMPFTVQHDIKHLQECMS